MSDTTAAKKDNVYEVSSAGGDVPEADTSAERQISEFRRYSHQAEIEFTQEPSKPPSGSSAELVKRIAVSPHEIREINRAMTRQTPRKEVQSLMIEREKLAMKKTKEGLTTAEQRRLKYVEWQLDRIDDAEYGESLDILEKLAERYQQFVDDFRDVSDRLSFQQSSKKPHRK